MALSKGPTSQWSTLRHSILMATASYCRWMDALLCLMRYDNSVRSACQHALKTSPAQYMQCAASPNFVHNLHTTHADGDISREVCSWHLQLKHITDSNFPAPAAPATSVASCCRCDQCRLLSAATHKFSSWHHKTRASMCSTTSCVCTPLLRALQLQQ